MLNPLHSVIDRGEHISSHHCMKILNIHLWQPAPPGSISYSEKVKGLSCFIFRVVQLFTECFKLKDSELNTFSINAIIKSSTKPRSGATTNRHLYAVVEKARNQEQRRTKLSFGRAMMWALELQQLAKRRISGRSDVEQWRNQAHSLSNYWVTLIWYTLTLTRCLYYTFLSYRRAT